MTEVVILISSLLLADLRDGIADTAPAKEFLLQTRNFNAELNFDAATPDPERPNAVFLTTLVDTRAQQFAESILGIDGVLSCYVKPDAESP